LEFCFSQPIWWSDRAHEYPRLLAASRQQSLLVILNKIDFESVWHDWQYWDLFACIIVSFSACAPIINLVNDSSREEASHLQRVLQMIAQGFKGRLTEEKQGWSFRKINEDNPEEASPHPASPSTDGLPLLPTFDVDEINTEINTQQLRRS
jgi:hypothetical protein